MFLAVTIVGSSTITDAQEKAEVDWDAAYEQLLKSDASVRDKVASGETTKKQVIAWMMQSQTGVKKAVNGTTAAQRLITFRKKLDGFVESGKLTYHEAAELYKIMADTGEQSDPFGDGRLTDRQQIAKRLKTAVRSGKMTEEEAKIAFRRAMKQGGKGRGKGKHGPSITDFYAIVIGRLESKDIELGEFILDVDHVSSMYENRWVKNEIVGKTVNVTGVSGQFLDKLLQIKRGETLKVRSGGYQADANRLDFAEKFHVLERAAPFNPEDFGVPPQEFRGFHGVLQGKIIEVGGYEVLMIVDEVPKSADDSKAANGDSIKGKRIRVVGFYNQHADVFHDLHVDDTIRLSVSHADPTHDELVVTGLLERMGK